MGIEIQHSLPTEQLKQQFAHIDAIIVAHRNHAVANVNAESLLTYWEIGQYVSYQLHHAL